MTANQGNLRPLGRGGCQSTTYPLEASPNPKYVQQVLDMISADQRLVFSGNFPNWQLGDPFEMVRDIPESMRRRVMVDNALALYGDRLLAPNRRAR